MQRITFLILKTSKSKDQGLFRGKILPYLTPSENDVFFAATVEPKQNVFLQRNCSNILSYPQTTNYQLTENWERRARTGLLASKDSNCKGIAQPSATLVLDWEGGEGEERREIKSIRTSQLQRNRNKTKTDNHQQQYKGCFSVYTEKRRCLNIERGFNFTKLQSKW